MQPPSPRFRWRQPDPQIAQALQQQGQPEWLARFLAGRCQSLPAAEALHGAGLESLPHPDAIPDMPKAVERILRAIREREKIVCAVDHDMDGQASAAVLLGALVDVFGLPAEQVQVVSSHRLREGYGITDALVERILPMQPGLVISADKGSSDEPRIARLAGAGVDVVVTDHHELPVEGPPASAYACVNPARTDSAFDPTICGAAVAFFCMARVRSALLAEGLFQSLPPLTPLLDFVAVATIADCVALRPDLGQLNRLLVQQGLSRLNSRQRPCWQAFCRSLQLEQVDSQTVGFQLAPAIAAAGRLDWADLGLDFLRASTLSEADRAWAALQAENQERKEVELRVRTAAFAQLDAAPLGDVCVAYLEDGHAGVHGITASRIVERYGRPAAVFAPVGQGDRAAEAGTASKILTASLRGIPGLHLRDSLQAAADAEAGLFLGFGGHVGAAGARLHLQDLPRFEQAWSQACRAQLGDRELAPEHWIDLQLPASALQLDSVDQLAALDPWGRDFPPPLFSAQFRVREVRAMGDGSHLRLQLDCAGQPVAAVWFSACAPGSQDWPLSAEEEAWLAFELADNRWRGRRSLQLRIQARIPCDAQGQPQIS
ncbi:MAG: single-stranded-DNA-specific exonuclease RecJ [Oceanococcaceae bacterium]